MSDLVTKEIAERLSSRREELRITQSEIARALKTSQTTVQKILIGEARESKFLRPIWQYLGLPLDELSGTPERPPLISPRVIEAKKRGGSKKLSPAESNENNEQETPRLVEIEQPSVATAQIQSETTLIATRPLGISYGWTKPPPGGISEMFVRFYHADGSSRVYLLDRRQQDAAWRWLSVVFAPAGKP